MRQLKRISFLIYSCLLLGAGFYGHIRYLEFFYPGSIKAGTAGQTEEEAKTAAVSAAAASVSGNTRFVVQYYDMENGKTWQEEETAPQKYWGMEREEFVQCMETEAESPLLEERQKGLRSIEVLSFSGERVVLRKSYYKTETQSEHFWLFLQNHMVVVCQEDKRTVYMQTVIDGRTLPAGLRDEILRGKKLDSRQELEAFLAQYSEYTAE